jgi:Cu+-exporting ATPase
MVSRVFSFFRGSATAEDPVCHMQVDTKNPPGGTHEHEGATYYFCGRGCRLEFEEDAPGYLSGEKSSEM